MGYAYTKEYFSWYVVLAVATKLVGLCFPCEIVVCVSVFMSVHVFVHVYVNENVYGCVRLYM